MDDLSRQLRRFRTRVRLVRAWRGLAVGILISGGIAALWAVLDWMGWFYTEWLYLGIVVGVGAVVGSVAGLLLPISEDAIASSIDRRAKLKDRLTTANAALGDNPFSESVHADAHSHLGGLKPAAIFPFRVGRWQSAAVAVSAVAAAVFLLGNTPLLLNDEQKRQAEELKREGAKVERIVKEGLEDPEIAKNLSPEERRLANELMKMRRDLEKNRLSKEEALQRANELAKKADELMQNRMKQALSKMERSDTALDKLRKEAMEQAGMGADADPELMKMTNEEAASELHNLSSEMQQMQAQASSLQQQMAALQRKLNSNELSAAERKDLEKQLQDLAKANSELKSGMEANRKRQEQIKLSREAREVFQKMMQHPLYKELQEIAKKLAQNAKLSGKPGEPPALTKEEIEELQRKLEELAKKLKDDKAMEEYLRSLIEAMKNAKQLGMCRGLSVGLGSLLTMPGSGGPSQDIWAGDNGKINKLDKEAEGRGTTTPTMAVGARKEGAGDETYVEIKAPTTLGTRTSIPYTQVLPSYKKKAESALDRKQIPKEHQRRVKEYFESLTGK